MHAYKISGASRAVGFRRLTSNKAPRDAPPPSAPSAAASSTSAASSSTSPSILRNPLLQWYVTKLDTHPLTTKIVSSGLISGSGDLLCQYLIRAEKSGSGGGGQESGTQIITTPLANEEGGAGGDAVVESNNDSSHNNPSFDWIRTLRFTILGSFLVAPVVHRWYGFLMSSIPGTSVSSVSKRLFCDQGLFAPIFLPTFISCLTVLEHVIVAPDEDERRKGDGGAMQHHDHDDDLYSRITTRLRNDVPDAMLVSWSMWIPSMAFMFAVVPGKFQVLFSNGVGFVWNAYLSWRTHEGEIEADMMYKDVEG
mmetsp:Transcript_24620/g.59370  ORF Transcript_24620/g.59370 Transcript_24620/m.59370 type:complete len:309 (-) Transcript_24620:447-1373(-)